MLLREMKYVLQYIVVLFRKVRLLFGAQIIPQLEWFTALKSLNKKNQLVGYVRDFRVLTSA